tara:strand:- start:3009 stop:3194 length:186 start_codon:yes stop_codon:yes gene_type:complete
MLYFLKIKKRISLILVSGLLVNILMGVFGRYSILLILLRIVTYEENWLILKPYSKVGLSRK